MRIILRIAFRNLIEHKSKTLIIGTLVLLSIALLVVSNSVMDTIKATLKSNYRDHYTGDIIITAKTEPQLKGVDRSVLDPVIPFYSRIYQQLKQREEISGFSPQISGVITLPFEGIGTAYTSAMGIDPPRYGQLFPNSLEILEGQFLNPDERGIMLSHRVLADIRSELGIALTAGDSVVVACPGRNGYKIREIPIRAVIRYRSATLDKLGVSMMDIQTLRSLIGLIIANNEEIVLDQEDERLLSESGEADMFGGDLFLQEEALSEGALREGAEQTMSLSALLGAEEGSSIQLQTDKGSWHFILMKVKSPRIAEKIISEFNHFFQQEEIEALAGDWLLAAGEMATFSSGFQLIFNIIILILSVVAVIVIMNTLVISVIERIPEIGTMRALGAQKGFVSRLFIFETLTITTLFGGAGLLLGSAVTLILGITGFRIPNEFLSLLMGSDWVRPAISLGAMAAALAYILVVGFIASLYPVFIALKIPPIRAIQTE